MIDESVYMIIFFPIAGSVLIGILGSCCWAYNRFLNRHTSGDISPVLGHTMATSDYHDPFRPSFVISEFPIRRSVSRGPSAMDDPNASRTRRRGAVDAWSDTSPFVITLPHTSQPRDPPPSYDMVSQNPIISDPVATKGSPRPLSDEGSASLPTYSAFMRTFPDISPFDFSPKATCYQK